LLWNSELDFLASSLEELTGGKPLAAVPEMSIKALACQLHAKAAAGDKRVAVSGFDATTSAAFRRRELHVVLCCQLLFLEALTACVQGCIVHKVPEQCSKCDICKHCCLPCQHNYLEFAQLHCV
jgi:hypothetical protein